MVIVFVIELQNNKFYVGKTSKNTFNFSDFKYTISEWTKLYKPLRLSEIKQNGDKYDVDILMFLYMKTHGIDNVRSENYPNIKMNNEIKNICIKMINNSEKKCYLCYETDHFTNDCPYDKDKKYNKKIIEIILEWIEENNKIENNLLYCKKFLMQIVNVDWFDFDYKKMYTNENKWKKHIIEIKKDILNDTINLQEKILCLKKVLEILKINFNEIYSNFNYTLNNKDLVNKRYFIYKLKYEKKCEKINKLIENLNKLLDIEFLNNLFLVNI